MEWNGGSWSKLEENKSGEDQELRNDRETRTQGEFTSWKQKRPTLVDYRADLGLCMGFFDLMYTR